MKTESLFGEVEEKELAKPSIYKTAREYRLQLLREVPVSSSMLDTPERVEIYYREAVATNPYHDGERETFIVLFLNTRRRCIGHELCSIGTLDTILVHPRDVFRKAIISGAAAIILMHNHPSGDPTPSEADIKVTRDLIRAGQLLKIEVLDHIIIGQSDADRPKGYTSLRELGYFY